MRSLSDAEQKALQRSEAEFSDTRISAARHLLTLLALCVMLAIVVAWFSLAHSDSLERAAQSQYQEVTHAKQELEQLSARLLETEEEGRKKLARELHDEIGQAVAILQIEITNANSLPDDQLPALRQHLVHAREVAERTVQTVRNISLLLRPTLLDDLGLIPAVQWLLEDFIRRTGIQCSLAADEIDENLPDSIKTCIYRIIQESLHNCEKHAGASKAEISISQCGDSLTIDVKDNGRGFQTNASSARGRSIGLGILGMRERATRVGGALNIETAPGHGTRVLLAVPVPKTVQTQAMPVRSGLESAI
jgi:signal transduction histidine kinase